MDSGFSSHGILYDNKGNNKRGHVPALLGVSTTITKGKAMTEARALFQEKTFFLTS